MSSEFKAELSVLFNYSEFGFVINDVPRTGGLGYCADLINGRNPLTFTERTIIRKANLPDNYNSKYWPENDVSIFATVDPSKFSFNVLSIYLKTYYILIQDLASTTFGNSSTLVPTTTTGPSERCTTPSRAIDRLS